MRYLYLLLTIWFLPYAASAWGRSQGGNPTDTNRVWLTSNAIHGGQYSWRMKKALDVETGGEQVSTSGYDTDDWLEAIVPGTVLRSLVYNEIYPEPYYGKNNKLESKLIPDISKTGRDFYTYWFRTEFEVPETFRGKTVWMQLDGINYRAEVWVNGNLLSTINGMFVKDYINVTEFVKPGPGNALAIKVYPVDVPGTTAPKPWGAAGEFHNGGNGNIGLNTTMLMSVGWDFTFMDGIRDRNTGIWRGISLYATGGVTARLKVKL